MPEAAQSPNAVGLTAEVTRVAGSSLRALLFYGSQLVNARPGRASAWDLVVIVEDYRSFHRALCAAGHHRRPAWLLTLLGHLLPPNVMAFTPADPDLPLAKCLVVSVSDFERAMGPAASDHFLKGRMVQQVAVLWASDTSAEHWAHDVLARARGDVLDWCAPWLPAEFTASDLARTFLSVSYGAELRPEGGERVEQILSAQQPFLRDAYEVVLDHAVRAGTVVGVAPGRFRLSEFPTRRHHNRVERYFLRSKIRSTLRWFKHIVTFNDWLTYIQKKVERRTGLQIEVTKWERRLPLILLWPKVFYVLQHRDGVPSKNAPAPTAQPSDPASSGTE